MSVLIISDAEQSSSLVRDVERGRVKKWSSSFLRGCRLGVIAYDDPDRVVDLALRPSAVFRKN